ncbi:MAG: hypothetical protein KDD42_04100 [Bdellovibrionales bacterium]|nr:hypothetical protein [Bdellovibrionales bacterium]
MGDDEIEVRLHPWECELILKYGYPFDEVKGVAEQGVSKGKTVTLKTSKYWVELLIGDLSYSANRATSDRVSEEIDELCTRLEIECNQGEKMLTQIRL